MRKQWHPVFARLLRPLVEGHYDVKTDVPVGDLPRQADVVLMRRTSAGMVIRRPASSTTLRVACCASGACRIGASCKCAARAGVAADASNTPQIALAIRHFLAQKIRIEKSGSNKKAPRENGATVRALSRGRLGQTQPGQVS